MFGREVVGEGEVRVSVNTTAAETGLKRMQKGFDRAMNAMDHRRAEAKVTANITDVDEKIAEVKVRMAEIDNEVADPRIDVDTTEARAEMKELKLELKALSAYKSTIQVDSRQLKEANRLTELRARKSEDMAKMYEKEKSAEGKATEQVLRDLADRLALEEKYMMVSKERSKLEKEGMLTGGRFPGRTREEAHALDRKVAETELLAHKIEQLGGDVAGLDRKDAFGSKLISWASKMRNVRVSIGPFSARLGTMAATVSTLIPLIFSLTGALGSLVGVLGAGIAGAAAVGSAAIGGFALSVGGLALASKGMVTHFKEQIKAAHDYRDSVLKYGKDSEQATHKLEQLQNITKGISKPAHDAVMGFSKLSDQWKKLTEPSRKPFWSIAEQSLKTIQGLMPTFATETNKTFATLAHSVDPLLKQLRGPGGKGFLESMMGNFRKALPELITGFKNLAVFIGNVSEEAAKFLPEVTGGFQKWTKVLADDSGTSKFRKGLDQMIEQGHDILHMFNVMGKTILLFFGQSTEAGDDLVNSLTRSMERWNEWMESVEGQDSLHEFFSRSATDTKNLFAALGPLLMTVAKLTEALAPLTSGALAFAKVLGEVTTFAARLAPLKTMLKALGVLIGALYVQNKLRPLLSFLGLVTTTEEKQIAATEALTASNEALAASYEAVAAGAETAAGASGVAGASAGGAGAVTAGEGAVGGGLLAGGGALAGLSMPVIGAAVVAAFVAKGLIDSNSTTKRLSGDNNHLLGGINMNFAKELPILTNALGITTNEKSGTLNARKGVLSKVAPDPKQFKREMRDIQDAAIGGMKQIGEAMKRGLDYITSVWEVGTPKWRGHTVRALKGVVASIRQGMAAGTITTEEGEQRINKILRRIKMIRGEDPVGVGEAMAKSMKKAGEITEDGANKLIQHLRQMAPKARETAIQANLGMLNAWADGHDKLEKQVQTTARMLNHKFNSPVAAAYANLAGATGESLKNIGVNTQALLKALGVKATLDFEVKFYHERGNKLREENPNQRGPKAEGGRIDQRMVYEVGEEAPQHHEWVIATNPAYKNDNIGYWMQAGRDLGVPGFKEGGLTKPQLTGGFPFLAGIGNAAIDQVYGAAQQYIQRHRPHTTGGLTGLTGPVMRQMWEALHAFGLNKKGAAGIIGNAYRESLLDPGAEGTGGGGLFGFTAGAISLANLKAAAGRANVPWTDVGFQVDFMMRHGGSALISRLNHSSSAAEAARIFMEEWERPGIPALGERENAARRAFKAGYKEGGSPTRDYLQWRGASATGLHSGIKNFAGYLMDKFTGLSVYDGYATSGHAPDSYHYKGEAVDMVGGNMDAEASWIGANYGSELTEGIHNPTLSIKDGQRVDPSIWGSEWANHTTHIHLAMDHPWSAKGKATKGGKASAGGSAPTPTAAQKERHKEEGRKGQTGAGGGTFGGFGEKRPNEISPTDPRRVLEHPLPFSHVGPNAQGLPSAFKKMLRMPGLTKGNRIAIGEAAMEAAERTKNEDDDKVAAKFLLGIFRRTKKSLKKRINKINTELHSGKKLTEARVKFLINRRTELITELASTQAQINTQLDIINKPPEEIEEEGTSGEEGAGGGSGGGGGTPLSQGEQLANLDRSRFELFNQFASNIAPIGSSALLSSGSFTGGRAAASAFAYNRPIHYPGNMPYLGETITGQFAHGGKPPVIVTNHFSAPPPDPHSWAHGVAFEVGALA